MVAARSGVTAEDVAAQARRGAWLSPVELARDHESAAKPVPTGRASNRGCLAMSLHDSLRLLDWTGRQLRRDKRGAIPTDAAPILERLKISGEGWMDLVKDFSRLFRRAAGTPAGWLFVSGTVIFSGSLYALSLSGVRWLGAITPLGGLAFLGGWACLVWQVWRSV